jgi:hypothetical protein
VFHGGQLRESQPWWNGYFIASQLANPPSQPDQSLLARGPEEAAPSTE